MKRLLISAALALCSMASLLSQDYLSVTGYSYLSYKPVSVRLVCYVAGYGDTINDANKKYSNLKMSLTRTLEQAGIPKSQITQNNFRIQENPDQENNPGKIKAEGFIEINHALMDSSDLIIDAVCKTGIARIDAVEIKKTIDPESYRRAYAEAYADAYQKAQLILTPAKRMIGKLTNASESSFASENIIDFSASSDMQFIQSNSLMLSIGFSFSIND